MNASAMQVASRARRLQPADLAGRACALLVAGLVLTFAPPSAASPQISGNLQMGWVQPNGDLLMWGSNAYGQIGDGTTATRSTPVRVLSDVESVSAGGLHTLAVKSDRTLWAWGANLVGQLGNGSMTSRTSPAKVMEDVKTAAAGQDFSLAVQTDGTLWAWGGNTYGQLGIGNMVLQMAPVKVLGGVHAVAAGANFAVAVKTDGSLWAWGDNAEGQVGDGTSSRRLTPVQIGVGVVEVAAGARHAFAIKSDATLWAWGSNAQGQLGDGTTTLRRTPVLVGTSIQAVAAGVGHSVVLRTDASVWSMGSNFAGQLGDGTTTNRAVPMKIGTGLQAIAAGQYSGAALGVDGSFWIWGSNIYAELADGSTMFRSGPIALLGNVTSTATGLAHSLAVKSDQTLWAWGANDSGQLGNNSTELSRSIPVQVLTNVRTVAAGQFHTLALRTDGTLWTWGSNIYGQLGSGGFQSRSVPAQVLSNVKSIAAGADFSLAVKNDGTLWAWGSNSDGQLGDGTLTTRTIPVQVMTGVDSVSAGLLHTLALRTDGAMFSWGNNVLGQLGDGTNTSRSTPKGTYTGIHAVAAGGLHSLALTASGVVFAWGSGAAGQVGDGNTLSRTEPVPIMVGVREIGASTFNSFAVGTDGSFWQWGLTYDGMLGPYAAAGSQLTPLKDLFIRNVTKIGSASSSYNALQVATSEGLLLVRGSNATQQLGINRTLFTSVPMQLRDPAASFAGTDLVVEFFNPTIRNAAGQVGIGHHFFTASAAESASIDDGGSGPGWARTKRTFRAWNDLAKAPANATGVCRFYAGGPNSHFYTADAAECLSLKNMNPTNNSALGWAYEGIAFLTVVPAAGVCPAGYQPVYRSYNNRAAQQDSNHRITPSYNDYYRSIRFLGYRDEGVAFCSPVSAQPGGDLQVTYAYPGPIATSGAPIALEFQFSNNGPGKADGGAIYVALAPEVTNWSITCAPRLGAACPSPALLNAEALRLGATVPTWPAGGGFKLTVTGTAPVVSAGGKAGLFFGATVANASQSPDLVTINDTPPVALTVVKGAACTVVVNPTSLALGPDPQAPRVSVISSCNWSAQSSDASWLTLSTGNAAPAAAVNDNGDAGLIVTLARNTSQVSRTARITLAGQTVTVTQSGAACSFSVSPKSLAVSPATQTAQITLATQPGCAWGASMGGVPWIAATPSSGSGSATISLNFQANTSPGIRSANVLIAGQPVAVAQSGSSQVATTPATPADSCSSIKLEREGDQVAAGGLTGSVSFAIAASGSCSWRAISNAPWVTLTAGQGGSGNGVVSYLVEPNREPNTRSGTIGVGGKSFTVHQAVEAGNFGQGDSGGDGGGGGSGSGGGSSGGGAG